MMSIILSNDIDRLPKEIEKGNIEYKRILNNIDKDRFNGLVSQMLWRIEEGEGIAYYFIGVNDDGTFFGLKSKQLKFSKKILDALANKCNANTRLINRIHKNNGYICQYEIKINDSIKDIREIKIAFTGCTDAGKSTLISVLANGDLDNGFGVSRINMFNHKHEIHSGLTSSISIEAIGYNKKDLINYTTYPNITLEQICKKSDKIISLIDLPGYKKYTKTTLFGLSTYYPDYIGLVISAISNMEDIEDDIKMCIYLNIPMFIVFSKIDLLFSKIEYDTIIDNIIKIVDKYTDGLRNINYIEDLDDFEYEDFIKNIQFFAVSCVNRTGIDLLLAYFEKLETKNKEKNNNLTEFIINDVFFRQDVGLILSGILINGTINLNDKLLIGCLKKEFSLLENQLKNIIKYDEDLSSEEIIDITNNNFENHNKHLWQECTIKSIHRKQVPFKFLTAGQGATIVVSCQNSKEITKNMVIIDKELRFNISNEFKIKIKSKNKIKIKKGRNITLHYRNIVEQVAVVNEDIHTNTIHIKILKDPIYVRNGEQVILRQNSIRFVGQIVEVFNIYC